MKRTTDVTTESCRNHKNRKCAILPKVLGATGGRSDLCRGIAVSVAMGFRNRQGLPVALRARVCVSDAVKKLEKGREL